MTELFAGLTIGSAASISPGPLQALVITSSLRGGFGSGWRVAIAPLVTDPVVIGVSVMLVAAVPDAAVGGLAVMGGLALVLAAVWSLRASAGESTSAHPSDVWMGVLVNMFSPHPWLFWVGAGAPILLAAWEDQPWRAVAFLAGFYVPLIGGKIALAGAIASSGTRLSPRWRRRLVVVSAVLLAGFGVFVGWSGLTGRL